MKKNYELIEHTADISIKVKGKDLSELFKNSALAMFDIIAEKKEPNLKKKIKIRIEQKADDVEELFVNWLNELLSLSAIKELIFSDFQIKKIDNNTLKAQVAGEDIKNYRVNTEIRAATYYELKIEEVESGWQAQLIFDV
ncbi:MAG: archease [Candidatus Omnitrophica bacterium]|nr:archease [Candidatus Omnitrophota bacterium]